MRHYIFTVLLVFSSLMGFSQEPFPFLNKGSQLPTDLLSKRAVVFMNVNSLNWEEEAQKIHNSFIEIGVDAVAYYALSDIMSGEDATTAFYADITQRSIKNMLIVHQSDDGFELYATKIPEEGGFFQKGMQAFFMKANSLKELGADLEILVNKSGLERENFLIIDVPETFKRTNVIKSRRVASFNPDIRIDKLAVPKFEENIMLDVNVEKANEELDSIMKQHYPFKYGLVDPAMSADDMISEGYLMVLKKLQNNGESLRRMLGYNLAEGETLLISVRKGENEKVMKYRIDEHVHKYYVQQLYTKDIYLGDSWDAGKTWQEALINHVENLKAKLQK
ncbi:hypothetical protein MATR_37000 [Marivirga tractuosa]|uniref:Uncharacterized protein n=1 Tax=Marivirga tractuosa (strain ATCC 23168 / DSM 4126 / NBRC 15989 / NCIMB 1408 / VKM B-1430 / H-43) TaxID=643867 RepID=E4TN40_MARTH|nr:hypothetical protein [Marivirga tractuosa]ADR22454.1 hypothetical protein Ftrac_2476 [Marivirga tractuosa DSM 4126]BDD16875.1 hypothetical protein MATR_37000 [Marivirga tractuosa]